MIVLLSALGWLLSAIAAFIPDMINVVSIIIQIGFWATPIFWNPDDMGTAVQTILKFNPMFYVCQGYRESFIYEIGFWSHPLYTVYFWLFVLIILIFGIRTFIKLRPQFDDVL